MKKIRELIVFTAFLVVALWKFDVVLGVLKAIWGIIFPFILGGAIAFLTNVPMSFLEKKIFVALLLLTQTESLYYRTVAVHIAVVQIVQKRTTLADKFCQRTCCSIIFTVHLKMLRQMGNTV